MIRAGVWFVRLMSSVSAARVALAVTFGIGAVCTPVAFGFCSLTVRTYRKRNMVVMRRTAQ